MGRMDLALLTLGVLYLHASPEGLQKLATVFAFSEDARMEGGKKRERLPPPPPNTVLCVARASFELVILDHSTDL